MRISDVELKKVIGTGGFALIQSGEELETSPREGDWPMIGELVKGVMAMPDRDELVAELKSRIEKGEYKPSADEIADVMIRRAIADRIR